MSNIDGRRNVNCRENILTPLSSQYRYGDMILDAIEVKKVLIFAIELEGIVSKGMSERYSLGMQVQ